MIYLIGSGGHGKVVLDALLALRCEVEVLDADAGRVGELLLGRKIAREEKVLALLKPPAEFLVAIGDGSSRRRVAERWEAAGHRLVRVLHPLAHVGSTAEVAEGAVVMAGAIVQAGARIGRGAIVNTGASVDHDCRVGDFAHIAPGAHLAGGVEVGAGAWIGIGATAIEGIIIGPRAVVGAGSVVVDDLPADVVAYGNPCRVVRRIGRGS